LVLPLVMLRRLMHRIDELVPPMPRRAIERVLGDGLSLLLSVAGLVVAALGFANASTQIGIVGVVLLAMGAAYRTVPRRRKRRLSSGQPIRYPWRRKV
jgi:4-hydroxybenzoate polyprenyltransferase